MSTKISEIGILGIYIYMEHLDENEIAACVDAIGMETVDRLSKEILAHLEKCLECKREIMEVWEIKECARRDSNSRPQD